MYADSAITELPRGLSLLEAYRHWSDPRDLRRLSELTQAVQAYRPATLGWDLERDSGNFIGLKVRQPPAYFTTASDERRALAQRLLHAFRLKLRSGELVATGLEAPLTSSSARILIPVHLWALMRPMLQASRAEGNGLKFFGVEVFEPAALAGAPQLREEPTAASLGKLCDQPEGPQVSLSTDGGELTIGSERFEFRGDIQKAIIKQLVDAHRTGHRLRTRRIIDVAKAGGTAISQAFKGSPNWSRLKLHIRIKEGRTWLEP